MLTVLLLLVVAPSAVQGQSNPEATSPLETAATTALGAYQVPFASEGNLLELTVATPEGGVAEAVAVRLEEAPAWLAVAPQEITLEGLTAGAEARAAFTFSVAEAAPVGEAGRVRFAITSGGAVLAEKELSLEVEAPREIVLSPNYPNPFNPRTTIAYALPSASRVRLVVYDVLGREVARLVEEGQDAGYHEVAWEAARYASGVYVYRLEVEGEGKRSAIRQGTMLLVK